MSIYSGFPTRKDEGNYNKILVKLFKTMQDHILELLRKLNQIITLQKAEQYIRILAKLKNYEEHKYLPPKFSEGFEKLQAHILQSHKVSFKNFKVMPDRSSAASIKFTETHYKSFKSEDCKLPNNRRSKSIMASEQNIGEQNFTTKANSTHYKINREILNRISPSYHQSGIIRTEQMKDFEIKSRLIRKRNIKDKTKVETIRQTQQNPHKYQLKRKSQLYSINRKLKTEAY